MFLESQQIPRIYQPQQRITKIEKIDLRIPQKHKNPEPIPIREGLTVGAVFERVCCETIEETEYDSNIGPIDCDRGTV